MYQIENLDRDDFKSDVIWSCERTAAAIGISPRALQRMRLANWGPAYRRVGCHVLYRQIDVLTYINSVTVAPVGRGGAASHPA